MTLYEINEQIAKAIELGFDPDTGEILDETALEQLQLDRNEKFKTARCSISYRKTSAVIVDDENEIPELCVRIRKEPNKTAIKDYINAGVSVPGAHIEDRQSMIIK